MARTGDTEASFATAVLVGLAKKTGNPYPATAANISWIESWVNREGGGGANNPLNTTYVTDTSTLLKDNSAGVRNYSSLNDGVNATVETLANGDYPNILSALRSGNAMAADQAGQLSKDLLTWSGGITNGQPNGKGYSTVANVAATPGTSVGTGAAATGTASFSQWLTATEPGLQQLANDPQVGPLLEQFYANGPDWADQFQQQLTQTNWWKNTPADVRQQIADQATDPGTLAQGLTNKQSYISTQAQQMGVALTPAQVSALAEQWQGNSGWSSAQITQAIAAHAPTAQGATSGEAATDINSLEQMYKNYVVPVTPATLNQQLQQVLAGTKTTADIQSSLAQTAQRLYASNPQLASEISDTTSTSDWAKPYTAAIANTMGINENTIDLSSPQYSFLLKPATDPTTGKSTDQALSVDQVQAKIQTDPTFQFSKTANGIQAYQSLSDKIKQAFTGAASAA